MNKILIEVASPAAERTYDVFVPDTLQIGELVSLLGELFARTSNGLYLRTSSPLLLEAKHGRVLEPNATVRSSEIRNGTKLLFY